MGITSIIGTRDGTADRFTADNTVNSVALVPPVAPEPFMQNPFVGQDFRFFQPQDNLLIKSIYVRIPYCFNLADSPCEIRSAWYNQNDTLIGEFIEFGNSGKLYVPGSDTIIPLETFIQHPSKNEKLYIRTTLTGNISQIGAPDSLNNEKISVYVYFTILHNLNLTI